MRYTRFGIPLRVTPLSSTSILLAEPVGGINLTQPASDLPPGQAADSVNWVTKQGFLEKRGMLQSRSTQSVVIPAPILGGFEGVQVSGAAIPFASTATRPVWYSAGSWSYSSYVSAYGTNVPPSASSASYWDLTQIYSPTVDENVVVMANQSWQTLFVQQLGTNVFSTLTGAPQARCVAAFDSFLVAMNVLEGTANYVQRVQWSDRGSYSSWTGGLSGFVDLLDMQGQGTRLVPQDSLLLAFSDREVWGGRRVDYPFILDFQPLDRSVGAPYPWTVALTRAGTMWLGRDWNVYLLPMGEAKARKVGDAIQRRIAGEIDLPERATAAYNPETDHYELWYPVIGGNGRCQRGAFFDLRSGAWSPQALDASLDVSKVWQGTLGATSASTTWSSASAAGLTWAAATGSWQGQFGATNAGPPATYAGSSGGTLFTFDTSATSDAGVVVEARWRSGGLGGEEPGRTKTVTEIRVDYEAQSASSLTVRVSPDQGASFVAGQRLHLPTASTESQVVSHQFVNARYPVVEICSETGRPKVARLWVHTRRQGR